MPELNTRRVSIYRRDFREGVLHLLSQKCEEYGTIQLSFHTFSYQSYFQIHFIVLLKFDKLSIAISITEMKESETFANFFIASSFNYVSSPLDEKGSIYFGSR